MAPTNTPANCHSANPSETPPTVGFVPENPPLNGGISTVCSDYKLQVSPSRQGLPVRVDPVSPLPSQPPSQGGQMEIEDSTKASTPSSLSTPKQNIKKCIQSYENLSPKTRQILKFAGIGLASVLIVLAIFYIFTLSEKATTKSGVLYVQHEIEKELQVRVEDRELEDLNQPQESKDQPEYETEPKVKIIKDKSGKAKQYDFPPPRRVPVFPHVDIERLQAKRMLFHEANESEVNRTLDIVQRFVNADRKKIFNKELKFWEPGSQPLRVLLVSTWRSGSTFVGQMLQSHPGVYQHYEPLSYIGLRQVRSGKEAFQSQQLLHRLLDCNYNDLTQYMNHTKSHAQDIISHNKLVWDACKTGPNKLSCVNSTFLSESCKMFPIQLVKTVRLRLNLTQLLLNDPKLRVKVLFLVRDPRGIMSSRYSSVSWCSQSSDCNSPEALCQDMEGDLKVAAAFEKLYPDRFLKIKYEDISSNPVDEAGKILSFLGLEFSDSIKNYINENTNTDIDKPWSVKRKSLDRIAAWKDKLTQENKHDIQNVCGKVIKSLKYEFL